MRYLPIPNENTECMLMWALAKFIDESDAGTMPVEDYELDYWRAELAEAPKAQELLGQIAWENLERRGPEWAWDDTDHSMPLLIPLPPCPN
jgi:hypothetical protein